MYFWSNYYRPGGMYSVVGQGLGNSILSSFSFDLNNFDNFPQLHSTLTQLAAKVALKILWIVVQSDVDQA